MTCRHQPGDPRCSSSWVDYPTNTPDAKKYQILDVEEIGKFLLLKIKYPNCSSCAFEGVKTIIYQNVRCADALKWTEIDPHFRDPKAKSISTYAPSPFARFPGSDEGWETAKATARLLLKNGSG